MAADPVAPSHEDLRLVEALRAGDEAVFALLVRELGPSMLRVARMYVSTRAVAEEVVQEAWLGVLNGIRRFEARSSLKTWIFRILTNTAKTRGERERRTVPFSALARDEAGADEPAVDQGPVPAGGALDRPLVVAAVRLGLVAGGEAARRRVAAGGRERDRR